MRLTILLLASIALACACSKPHDSGQTGSGGDTCHEPECAATARDNGQTGSVGYGCSEQECAATWQAWLANLNATRGVAAPRFVSATCDDIDKDTHYVDGSSPKECKCTTGDGQVIGLRPAMGSIECPCGLRGRGSLCLLPGVDAPPCEPDDPTPCKAACDDAERRLSEDAERTFDAQVRFAQCATSPGRPSSDCRAIVRINDQCYTNDSAGFLNPGVAYDCAQSDEEILQRVFGAGIDAGVGDAGDSGDAGGSGAGGASPTYTAPAQVCGLADAIQ